LFRVATGTTEALYVNKSGNVGIGTTSPSYLLHVFRSTDGNVAGFTDSSGTCTINPIETALICSSDIRAKQDINTLSGSLEKILALNPINFRWKNQKDETWRFGFAAQEVEKIIPELVFTDSNGSKSLNQIGFISFLVGSVQEQQKQIEELKKLSVQQNEDGQIVQIDIKGELANLGLIVNENGVLEVDTLKTRQLCVGSVCVTEAEFQAVFGAGSSSGGSSGDTGDSGGSAPDVCDATHLNFCSTQADCEASAGYWYNDICNAEIESVEPEPVCSAEHLDLCVGQELCEGANLYWYNDVCNLEPEPEPQPEPVPAPAPAPEPEPEPTAEPLSVE